MTILSSMAALLPLLGAVSAESPASSAGADTADTLAGEGQTALTRFTESVTTYEAQFTQVDYTATGDVRQRQAGSVVVQRPGQFRWIYATPFEQQLIADGTNLWSYDVDLDSVSVRGQEETLARSPADILAGTVDALTYFDFQGAFERDEVLWVQLGSRDSEADFTALRLGFREDVLVGMELANRLQQRTEIVFREVRTNQPVDASLFEFLPPVGIDVEGVPLPVAPGGSGEP
ncbi:MAG: outer membrane lipoprotein chaperone LolA [Pseudomonadota bacterium]